MTKLGEELCIAGVDRDGSWIRPISLSIGGWRQFYKDDIYDKNNKPIIALSNIVMIRLIRRVPVIDTPHIEDWEYDRRHKPIFIRTLGDSERLRLFQEISQETLAPLIENHERSLCLIEPSSVVLANFANISRKGKYQPILDFTLERKLYSYKVTDIYWRAIGRYLLTKGHGRVLDSKQLHNILRYSKLFLTIGLTRLYRDQYWPMVVGVHLVPYFPVEVDYESI